MVQYSAQGISAGSLSFSPVPRGVQLAGHLHIISCDLGELFHRWVQRTAHDAFLRSAELRAINGSVHALIHSLLQNNPERKCHRLATFFPG